MPYAGGNEEFNDLVQWLCPIEINNDVEFSLDDLEVTDLLMSNEGLPTENLEEEITRDISCICQVRPGSKKRGRPRVCKTGRKGRDEANARERKRMNQLTRYKGIKIMYSLRLQIKRNFHQGLTKL